MVDKDTMINIIGELDIDEVEKGRKWFHLLFNFAINFLVISLSYYFSVVNFVINFYY